MGKFLCWHIADGLFWFRVFGVGLKIKSIKKRGLLFSERNGYTKFLKIGDYAIVYLPRWKGVI